MRPGALALVVLALLACGETAEERHFQRVRGACRDLVGRGATLAEADDAFDVARVATGCSLEHGTALSDRCDAALPSCTHVWQFRAADPLLCSGNEVACAADPARCDRPCWYGCEARFQDVACAARFFESGGPFPGVAP